jgi:hypothetical protein
MHSQSNQFKRVSAQQLSRLVLQDEEIARLRRTLQLLEKEKEKEEREKSHTSMHTSTHPSTHPSMHTSTHPSAPPVRVSLSSLSSLPLSSPSQSFSLEEHKLALNAG